MTVFPSSLARLFILADLKFILGGFFVMKKRFKCFIAYALAVLLLTAAVDFGKVAAFADAPEFETAQDIGGFSTVVEVRTEAELRAALTSGVAGRTIRLNTDITLANDWSPINVNGGNFILDGHGFILSLHVNRNANITQTHVGLLGEVSASTIQIVDLAINTTSRGISASSNNNTATTALYAGGLISEVQSGSTVSITRVMVTGNITATRGSPSGSNDRHGYANAGGFIGQINGGNVTISSCYYRGTVQAIVNGQNTGSVTSGNRSNAHARAGGFVGNIHQNNGVQQGTLNISNSYMVGTVQASARANFRGNLNYTGDSEAHAGGIVGRGTLSGGSIGNYRSTNGTPDTPNNSSGDIRRNDTNHSNHRGTLINNLNDFRDNPPTALTNANFIRPQLDNGATATAINGGYPIYYLFYTPRNIRNEHGHIIKNAITLSNTNFTFDNSNSTAQSLTVTLEGSPLGTYEDITFSGSTVTFNGRNSPYTHRIISTSANPTFNVQVKPVTGTSPGNSTFSLNIPYAWGSPFWTSRAVTANVNIGHIRHDVTFNLNLGNVSGSTANIIHQFNQGATIGTANVPVPTRTNHRLLGWRRTSPTPAETENISREQVG
ncbi:MAG: hypothetical protein FWD19_02505, partial [Defluviitaleaceae bacterium]|nr:hypothetical protein [Defluviitaleaceae bacterium]